MHTRYIVTLISLFFFAYTPAALGQFETGGPPEGTVVGSVVDRESGMSLASTTVALHSVRDSSIVTGAITGADGNFQLENIELGDYYVRVSFVGYDSRMVRDVEITQARPEVDLGVIELQVQAALLQEVEISAEREYMEVGVDRTVYNTQNQPVTAGGSAQDVLENIPSVEVDIDGNISLRGSQSVMVYLNGKPSPMSQDALTGFLAGLSAEDIERIEVIPNPSARYAPEGMGGILNIELAKDVNRGWGGSISGNAGTRGRYGGSVSTNYGSGPWSMHTNYGQRYSQWDRDGWRYRENRYLDPLTFLEQDMTGTRGGLSHNINTSIDYDPNPSNTFSLSVLLSHRNRNGNSLNRYAELDAARDVTDRYTRATIGDETDFNMDYRLSYKRTITPREEELSVEARFEQEQETELERYVERVFPLETFEAEGMIDERQDVDEDAREREASLEIDYVRPLGERNRLELGYEGEQEWVDEQFYSETQNDAGVFVPDANLNNTFTYSEQTHSAYAILGSQLGKFGAQLGARLEAAFTNFDLTTTGEVFDNRYFSIYPSAHLSYELTETNTFKVSYSKRVRRPNEWQLNPFGDYDDPTSIRKGNPYLTPEYTHSGEISYSRLGERYTLTFSPYLRYTVDEISWNETITEDGVTILSFENFDTEQSYGVELIGSLTFGQWLKGNASLNAYKRVTEAGSLSSELSNDALGFRTRLSMTADIGAGLKLQVSQFYRSPMDIPGGRIAAWLRTDVALQKEVFSGRGSLNLRARDLLGAPNELIQRDLARYYQESFQERNSRSIQLSFRYTFNQSGGGGGERGDRGGRRGRR